MSNAGDLEQLLISKFNSWLPAYTVYTEWEEEGLEAKYGIHIAVNYSTQTELTNQDMKIAHPAVIYMYRQYEDDNIENTKAAEKEQLRTDLELVLSKKRVRLTPGQDIVIFDERNQKKKVKATFFNIIFE